MAREKIPSNIPEAYFAHHPYFICTLRIVSLFLHKNYMPTD